MSRLSVCDSSGGALTAFFGLPLAFNRLRGTFGAMNIPFVGGIGKRAGGRAEWAQGWGVIIIYACAFLLNGGFGVPVFLPGCG